MLANSARFTVSILAVCSLVLGSFFSNKIEAAAFTSGNLVVYRVGDGSAALTPGGTAIFLDEYTPSGTLVQTITLPTSALGAQRQITASGTATSEGLITRSADGQYLVFAGYDAPLGTANITSSGSATFNRVIARVAANGSVDTSTALADASSGSNPRAVVSTDGNAMWITGGAGGIRATTLGATTSTQVSASVTNLRAAHIFGGQLYASSGSGTFRVTTVGAGLPVSTVTTITNLPSFPTTGSPYQFFFADLDAGVPGVDTLYVADDTGAANIQKYSLVAGNWTANGSVALSSSRGLTATVSGSTVTLYITQGNSIKKHIDSSGYNAAITAGTPVDLATAVTAGTNKAFRGIALAPQASNLPDLTVVTTAPTSASVSANYTYTITVNSTGANATGVTATFAIPAGTTYVSNSVGTTTFTGAQASGTVTFSGGTVNTGTPAVLTVTVTAPAAATTITLTAVDTKVDPLNAIAESNETNNNDTAAALASTMITTVSLPDLTISRTGPASATTSTIITYTLTISNGGTAAATGVAADFTLPSNVTHSATNVGATGFSAALTAGVVKLTGGTVNVGTPAIITVDVVAPAIASTVTSATSTAIVDPLNTVTESVETNNAALNVVTTTVSLPPTPDLTVALTAPSNSVINANYDYTITVSNGGTAGATNVKTQFTLPAGLTYVGANIGTTNFVAAQSGGVVTFSGGTVPTTTPQVLKVTVTAPAATTTIAAPIGAAQVDPLNAIIELSETNNSSAVVNTAINGVSLISAVQGSGTASPMVNTTVLVEGIVTAIYQGTGTLGGFFMQEEDADSDANALTSEGIFVYTNLAPAAVTVGDKVRVSGTVIEFGNAAQIAAGTTLTEITSPTVTVVSSSNALPTEVIVTLPVAALSDLERFEGMRVKFTQTLTLSDHFDLPKFGELTFSVNGRSMQPTAVIDPNDAVASGTTSTGATNVAAINAMTDLTNRSSIILDDALTTTYPSSLQWIDPTTNTIRLGSTIAALSGIFSQSFGTYRMYTPVAPTITYAPRPAAPNVGGNVKIASANLLNYFNGTGDALGVGGYPTARGANTAYEFSRQRAKTIAALNGIGADIIGVLELENDGTTTVSPNITAMQDLINGLNAVAGAGTWAAIAEPVGYFGFFGGSDAIRPAFIYKPAVVSPVGVAVALNDAVFTISRAPIAQTWKINANNEQFVSVINHFKAKSSSGATLLNADQNDGQASWNALRKTQATAVVNFINTLAATTPRVITMGDFNAYEQEDPIDIMRAGGLTTLVNNSYSYMFNGLSGSLDHALANAALLPLVTGADEWHINADEPELIDYNVEQKMNPGATAGGCGTFSSTTPCTNPDYWTATPFRASDHDPLLVGLSLKAAQTITFNAQTTTSRVFSTSTFSLAPVASISAPSNLAISYTSATPLICSISGTTVTIITVGTCTIEANQAGDLNFTAATAVQQSITITQAPQVITFGTLTNRAIGSGSFTVAATGGASAIALVYASTTGAVCSVTGGNNVNLLTTGTCTITAAQGGNANYLAATTVPQSFQILSVAASATLIIGRSSAPAVAVASFVGGDSAVLTASITGVTPTGTVSFSMNAAAVAGCTAVALTGGGNTKTATCALPVFTNVAPGARSFGVSYLGDSNNTAVSASTSANVGRLLNVTATVIGANGSISPAGLTTVQSGQTVTFTITANPRYLAVLGGTCGVGNSPPVALVPQNAGTFSLSTAPVTDDCTVSVSFVAVTPALRLSAAVATTPSTPPPSSPAAASPAATTSVQGQALRIQAVGYGIVGAATASSSNVVNFFADGAPIAGCQATPLVFTAFADTSARIATCETATLATGARNLTASYGGDIYNFTAAADASQTPDQTLVHTVTATPVVIVPPITLTAQTITVAAISAKQYGAAPFAVAASATSGLSVVLASTTPSVCTVSGNTVTVAAAGTAAVICTLTANQAGNATFATAAQVVVSFSVTATPVVVPPILPDTTPNAFIFVSVINQALSLPEIRSNAVTVSGIDAAAPISVTGGEYSISCTASFTDTAATINNNQTVCVRHAGAVAEGTTVTTSLTIGGVVGAFSSTTATVIAGGTRFPLYRLYNTTQLRHFYTTNEAERTQLIAEGWQPEGIVAQLIETAGTIGGVSTKPLFRLYHAPTNYHFWTSDANENTVLATRGWVQQGTVGYLGSAPNPLGIKFNRLIRGDAVRHVFTTDQNEAKFLVDVAGYIDEGVVGYALK